MTLLHNKTLERLNFDNSFVRLAPEFFSRVNPTPFSHPHLVAFNSEVAALLDLASTEAHTADFCAYFSGQKPLLGSMPLAMKYSGHQFGGYNPELGDGRGLLLGEVLNAKGERWDIHLKGAGRTPYSRFGDGRAVLRSCIREYLGSEAIYHLGIASTRALAIIGSDEPVQRETVETGAMLVRIADSHIRFGHFEWLYHSNQPKLLRTLLDYVIARHYPEYAGATNRAALLFSEVVKRTAQLMAQWQLVGFAHGVMNTDNFSITGCTFDYGPYGFLDAYQPGFICNHSDHSGRYAWNQQPSVGLWNLNALAHALSGLIDKDFLTATLQGYEAELIQVYETGLRAKLGLATKQAEDAKLGFDFLNLLMKNNADYTRSFRALSNPITTGLSLRDDFLDRAAFDAWWLRYQLRLSAENSDAATRKIAMEQVNPKYILRNYLAQIAIEKAEAGDYSEVTKLLQLLQRPFDEQPEHNTYVQSPPDWGRELVISCSS